MSVVSCGLPLRLFNESVIYLLLICIPLFQTINFFIVLKGKIIKNNHYVTIYKKFRFIKTLFKVLWFIVIIHTVH
ncbi:hypothetical protein C1645_790506 [Glomus cerebriforme]|uniref:Uncharacterized protein n=1 Tax=Glomus cerebriforme TaxID=658196 RepID=A0A397SF66_9GLOM|nr:hypothetical protein C1645_790506 [Glomus cerebriforme]